MRFDYNTINVEFEAVRPGLEKSDIAAGRAKRNFKEMNFPVGKKSKMRVHPRVKVMTRKVGDWYKKYKKNDKDLFNELNRQLQSLQLPYVVNKIISIGK